MVGVAHVVLGDDEILHGGFQPVVAEDDGDFLDPHAVVDQAGGQGAAEPVRMHVLDAGIPFQPLQEGADSAGGHPFRALPDEQGGEIVFPFRKIPEQVHGRHVAEVDLPLLRTLAVHDALKRGEIHVGPVQGAHLADPASGGQQEVQHGAVPVGSTGLGQTLDVRIGERAADRLRTLDGRDIRAGIVFEQSLPVQPAEEAVIHGAVSLHGALGGSGGPDFHEIPADVEDRHLGKRHLHGVDQPVDAVPVPLDRLLRPAFDLFCREVRADQLGVVDAVQCSGGRLDLVLIDGGGDDAHRIVQLIFRQFFAELRRDLPDQNGLFSFRHVSHLLLDYILILVHCQEGGRKNF